MIVLPPICFDTSMPDRCRRIFVLLFGVLQPVPIGKLLLYFRYCRRKEGTGICMEMQVLNPHI